MHCEFFVKRDGKQVRMCADITIVMAAEKRLGVYYCYCLAASWRDAVVQLRLEIQIPPIPQLCSVYPLALSFFF